MENDEKENEEMFESTKTERLEVKRKTERN